MLHFVINHNDRLRKSRYAGLALTVDAGIRSTASVAPITTSAGVQQIFAGLAEEPVTTWSPEKPVISGTATDDIVTSIAADHSLPHGHG
jgi:hypothetical protein